MGDSREIETEREIDSKKYNHVVPQEGGAVYISMWLPREYVPKKVKWNYFPEEDQFVVQFDYPEVKEEVKLSRIDEILSIRVGAESGNVWGFVLSDVEKREIRKIGLRILEGTKRLIEERKQEGVFQRYRNPEIIKDIFEQEVKPEIEAVLPMG
jgi:hypothetical protein